MIPLQQYWQSCLITLCLLFISPIISAMTVDELAAQFSEYKQQQAVELNKIREENASLRSENQALKKQFAATQKQVKNNTVAVDTVSENYDSENTSEGWWERTTIGGYGELHYNNRQADGKEDKHEIDFHRFVLFFGHEFSDQLRFFSELELEHSIAGDGKNGEIELEQAYLEYDYTDWGSAKAGLFLMPVGIINETHEPDTFYGVERNEVEKRIIPATWWEAGIATNVRFDHGISLDLAVTSGLKLGNDLNIRSGRGKVSQQDATDPALSARIKYTGLPGLELAATVIHQTDMAQSDTSVDVGSGTLYETHAIYSHAIGPGTFTGKALYSHWHINARDPKAANQYGWYLEPSYRFPTSIGDVGIYGRYQNLEYFKNSVVKSNIWETGANWWIHENVVLKGTYIHTDTRGSENESGFDLGIGYQF